MRKDTKARDFDRATKIAIMERDSIEGWPCCVYCGAAAPSNTPVWSNAHFIARSQGGLGTEWNGLTLCHSCHRRYDQTTERAEMREFFREYLQNHYPGWNEKMLVQNKAGGQ